MEGGEMEMNPAPVERVKVPSHGVRIFELRASGVWLYAWPEVDQALSRWQKEKK